MSDLRSENYSHRIVDWVLIGLALAIIIAAVVILMAVLPLHH
jgi:type IV secretory pathway component VirB8